MRIKTGYNRKINEAFRKLGKSVNGEIEIYPEMEAKVLQLIEALKKTVLVEIKANTDFYQQGPLEFCGATLAKASGRDSGAWIPPSVSHISGTVDSGGSMKNWHTKIAEGAVFRLQLPELIFNKYASEYDFASKIVTSEADVSDVNDLI